MTWTWGAARCPREQKPEPLFLQAGSSLDSRSKDQEKLEEGCEVTGRQCCAQVTPKGGSAGRFGSSPRPRGQGPPRR